MRLLLSLLHCYLFSTDYLPWCQWTSFRWIPTYGLKNQLFDVIVFRNIVWRYKYRLIICYNILIFLILCEKNDIYITTRVWQVCSCRLKFWIFRRHINRTNSEQNFRKFKNWTDLSKTIIQCAWVSSSRLNSIVLCSFQCCILSGSWM